MLNISVNELHNWPTSGFGTRTWSHQLSSQNSVAGCSQKFADLWISIKRIHLYVTMRAVIQYAATFERPSQILITAQNLVGL
jgi:hypothetical protein